MKQYITISAILILFVAMLACEKIVDFNQTAYKPKLVLYGALFQDSVPEVMVGKTQSYYGWQEGIQQQAYVEGASVSLSEGQNNLAMPLGGFKSDFFDVWEGLPTGYGNNVDFYRISAPQDSTYRVYAGNQTLKGGTWYEFEASLDENEARRSVYIPNRPGETEVSFAISDTSYRVENMYGEGVSTDTKEKRYELIVTFAVNDNENVWYKPIVTYEVPIFGYYIIDNYSQYGGYQYVEDSIDAKFSPYASFTKSSGAGQKSAKVLLGTARIRNTTYPDGYSYIDTSYYLPMSDENQQRFVNGDTIEQTFEVKGLVSHAQDETMEFVIDLLTQRYGSSDPFNFSEPVIVNANDEEGLGLLGGFAESKTEVVKVKFYK